MEIVNKEKALIDEIFLRNSKFYNYDQPIIQSNLLETISEDIYPDPTRFIIEIIQNCDDASSMKDILSLNFNFKSDCMIISHDGKEFDVEDVETMCSVGNSNKIKNSKVTGYKGIGFKSVFYQSEKVIIISNNYQFRFDKNYFNEKRCWQEDWGNYDEFLKLRKDKNSNTKLKKPWQIIPIWTENKEIRSEYLAIARNFKVSFIIYLKPSAIETCKSFVYEFEKDHMYFMFLKSSNINFSLNSEDRGYKSMSKKVSESIVEFTSDDNKLEGKYYLKRSMIEIDPQTLDIIMNIENFPKKLVETKMFEISFAVGIKNDTILPIPKEKRLIYAFLPTKVNCNFPFLINSNFILEASRTQLKEEEWNMLIFKKLPHYIFQFQQELFNKFGNSYSNILFNTDILQFNSNKFKTIFVEEFEKIKELNLKLIKIKTVGDLQRNIPECFLNEFNLNLKNVTYNKIENLFQEFYPRRYESILMDYYESKFYFHPENEIPKSDLLFVEKIKKFYSLNYFKITNEDVLGFLKSEQYKKYYDENVCYRILTKFFNTKLQDIIKYLKIPIVRSKNGNFIPTQECIVFKPDYNSIYYKIIKESGTSDRFNEENLNGKKEIPDNLLDKFDKGILENYGVTFLINEDSYIMFISNHLDQIYNKNNSVDIIRLYFRKWLSTPDLQSQILEKLKPLKFIVKNGKFLTSHFINIGEFYTGLNDYSVFNNYSISEEYYEEDSNAQKSNWCSFFKQLGFVSTEKCISMNVNVEILLELPYFSIPYKEHIKSKNFSKEDYVEMTIFPFLDYIWDADNELTYFYKNIFNPEAIKKIFFRTANISNNLRKSNKTIRNEEIDNYFIWSLKEKKKILDKNDRIKKYDELFSYDIFKKVVTKDVISISQSVKDEIEKIFFGCFSFLPNRELESTLNSNGLKLKTTLEETDILKLLENIYNNKKKIPKNVIEGVKAYFYQLTLYLSFLNKNLQYSGKLLDDNNEFRDSNELYYFKDNFEDILGETVKNLKLLKCESDNPREMNNFIHFCRRNGVKVYTRKDIFLKQNENPTIVSEIPETLKRLSTYIYQLLNSLKNFEITEKGVKLKLTQLKFWSCNQIQIGTTYNDIIEHIFFYKITNNCYNSSFEIYYLQDDVYTSWKHPTILYFISNIICQLFESTSLHAEIFTLLSLHNETLISKWISKKSLINLTDSNISI